jgi:hypothetical protein
MSHEGRLQPVRGPATRMGTVGQKPVIYFVTLHYSAKRPLSRLLEEPREVRNLVAAQSVGNLNSRSTAWKRGSLRK